MCIEYADEGNAGLLADYGFAEPLHGAARHHTVSEEVHLGGDHVVGSMERHVATVQRVRQSLLGSVRTADESPTRGGPRVDDVAVSVALMDACTDALDRMGTSEADDRHRLSAASGYEDARLVDALRLKQGRRWHQPRLGCPSTPFDID